MKLAALIFLALAGLAWADPPVPISLNPSSFVPLEDCRFKPVWHHGKVNTAMACKPGGRFLHVNTVSRDPLHFTAIDYFHMGIDGVIRKGAEGIVNDRDERGDNYFRAQRALTIIEIIGYLEKGLVGNGKTTH